MSTEEKNDQAVDTGIVSKYIPARGYGFITPEGKQPMESDIFVHHTEAPAGLKEGDKVSYSLGESEHNDKDVVAVGVAIIESSEETTDEITDETTESPD